ncbi:MAG TPA: LuxR C-terminal-related transcriptional regulator [Terriglobales bacterium]|nr:LuxR C-terminal-related transcriptional regulator [Terriglobales bacterium]
MEDLIRQSLEEQQRAILQQHTTTYESLDGKLRRVAELLMQGADNATIAAEMGSPVRTVKARVHILWKRFGMAGERLSRVRLTKALLKAAGQVPVEQRIDPGLTPKEAAIVAWVCQGFTNAEVAARAHTTHNVIRNYLRTIYDKVGMFSRLELAVWYEHHQTSIDALPIAST